MCESVGIVVLSASDDADYLHWQLTSKSRSSLSNGSKLHRELLHRLGSAKI